MTRFSETTEAGNAVAPCDPSIIPIFPMRYALSADILTQMIKSKAETLSISRTQITNHAGMELLRIRQGYIFIFAENHRGLGSETRQIWQAFRYQTGGEDDNSSIPRADTQLQSGYSGGYSFLKYHWSDGTAGGNWEILPNERRYPYAFVSSQATTVWVAYSEYRWPAKYFERAANDLTFREELMAKVEVQSQSGIHAAPLSRLAELAPIFRGAGSTKPPLDIPTENALRHTAIETEQMDSIAHCPNSREKGIVVALKDPIGEHLDIGRLLSIHATTRAAFYAEHQYPILIGRAIENLIAGDHVSAKSMWPSWMVTVPVSAGYQAHFDKVNGTLIDLEASEDNLIRWFNGMLGREYDGTILHLIAQAEKLASEHAAGSKDQQDCLAYALLTFQRTYSLITSSQQGSNAALNVVDRIIPPKSKLEKFTELMHKVLTQVAGVVNGSVKIFHKSFLPALEVTFTVFGKEIALAGTRHGLPSGAKTIMANMFVENVGTITSKKQVAEAFQKMLNREGLTSGPRTNVVLPRNGGQVTTGNVPITPPETRRVGLITFETRMDFMATDETISRLNRRARIERLGNGIGSLMAFASLYSTLNNMDAGSVSVTDAGQFIDDPRIKLITGFAEAYAAVVGVYEASAVTTNTVTARALSKIFGNNATLSRAVSVSVSKAGTAARFLQVSGKLAGVIGIGVSFAMAFEGARRGDRAMMVGNSLMAVGAIALLALTGVGAAIAVAVIIAGFLISLASLSDIELWVNFGFYGNSDQYWGVRRAAIDRNTEIARALAYENDPDHAKMRKFLEEELADYLDRTSSLAIKNEVAGDGKFEVHCELIQSPGDVGKVSVTVNYSRGWLSSKQQASSIQKAFVSPGLVQITPVAPGGRKWSDVDVDVEVSRRNGGKHSESESFDFGKL